MADNTVISLTSCLFIYNSHKAVTVPIIYVRALSLR